VVRNRRQGFVEHLQSPNSREIAVIDRNFPTENQDNAIDLVARKTVPAAGNGKPTPELFENAGIPVTEMRLAQGHDEMVGSCQPPENQIRRGAEEFALLEQERSHTWIRWKYVIAALNLIDTLAMREAKTNEPKGGKFNRVVRKFLRCYGLDRIHKSDRSRMRKYAGKLEVIDAWRAEQPAERQLELNHPRIVYDQWNQSLSRPALQPHSEPESEESNGLAELLAVLNRASNTDVTAALRIKKLDWFLDVMPFEWRPEIQARLRGLILRQERARHPNTRLKHLKIVSSTESPTPH
jgi:hypothetical protein